MWMREHTKAQIQDQHKKKNIENMFEIYIHTESSGWWNESQRQIIISTLNNR